MWCSRETTSIEVPDWIVLRVRPCSPDHWSEQRRASAKPMTLARLESPEQFALITVTCAGSIAATVPSPATPRASLVRRREGLTRGGLPWADRPRCRTCRNAEAGRAATSPSASVGRRVKRLPGGGWRVAMQIAIARMRIPQAIAAFVQASTIAVPGSGGVPHLRDQAGRRRPGVEEIRRRGRGRQVLRVGSVRF